MIRDIVTSLGCPSNIQSQFRVDVKQNVISECLWKVSAYYFEVNMTNICSRSIYNYLPLTESKGYEGGTFFAAIQQDLPTLIFISRIPKEFDDDDMNELLNVFFSNFFKNQLSFRHVFDGKVELIHQFR